MKALDCDDVTRGQPLPLGASVQRSGVNFAVFARDATGAQLLLFEPRDLSRPVRALDLDFECHRTGDIWHVGVTGIGPGWAYTWRMTGPHAPEEGHRYDARRMLLDPHAMALVGTAGWDFARLRDDGAVRGRNPASFGLPDDAPLVAKSLVVESEFDWQNTCRPKRPWSETVIYETHVRGLTIHASAGVTHPGQFLGVIEKIPYLQSVGVTAIELLPIHEFFENELTRSNPQTGERLRNYWGYSPVAFCAPKEGYSTRTSPGAQVDEFKTMVRELHRNGLEVILDVVFNHTAEGDESGPTFSFRGLDNRIYYLLERDRHRYANFSGVGNTLNCNHPVVRDFVLDCLRYWVVEMHIDGFRFDLASVLGRDTEGRLQANAPLLERIAEDPVLRDVKLIAEAWDAGGAYEVGRFPGQRWSEWNGQYRDDVRRFWRGDPGARARFATRFAGSSDLYDRDGKSPVNSINFVTCHDGFTLADLVTYASPHNLANGEGNRDGPGENFSAHYGVEGPTDDVAIVALRTRQIKNFLATLLISRGVPMLLGGDEFARTQRGNTNAYCQDNEISWYDWRGLEAHAEIARFTRALIAFRRQHAVLRAERFYTREDLQWFDAGGHQPVWDAPDLMLGCTVRSRGMPLCFLFNPSGDACEFQLPALAEATWALAFDTGREPRDDVNSPGNEPAPGPSGTYRVVSRAMVGLVGRKNTETLPT